MSDSQSINCKPRASVRGAFYFAGGQIAGNSYVRRYFDISPPRLTAAVETGGEGGIRTPGELTPTEVFKTSAIDHSATSPK